MIMTNIFLYKIKILYKDRGRIKELQSHEVLLLIVLSDI